MEHSMRKRCIQLTIQRAEEQGLDVSANDLVECLFSSSDDISSDDESGDCCLKDLTDNEDQFMSTLDNHSLSSVRSEKCTTRTLMIQIRPMGHRIMEASKRMMSNFVIIRDVKQQRRVRSLGHSFIRPSQKRKRERQNMFAI